MKQHEIVLRGGMVSSPVKSGDTVRRTAGEWTPVVQELLAHLERKGFAYTPRPLGIDEKGREILSYLPGDSVHRPWIPVLKTDKGMRQVARMIRLYHEAIVDFRPPVDMPWRIGPVAMRPGQIIRHGDLGPWNTLWQGDKLTALIDWDLAEPADKIVDVAQMAWYFVPLRAERGWREAGFSDRPDFWHRLDVMVEEYGEFSRDELLAALLDLQQLDLVRTKELGGNGRYPWSLFWNRGGMDLLTEENMWLKQFINSDKTA
jgi:Phosphotransferase enzyme family